MSLNKEFFNRETNITAKVVADSISESGQRITTLEVEYPRFIHCFDESTEVLAKIGGSAPEFMSFEKVFALDALVAQYNVETEDVSFVEPLEKIVNDGEHNMVVFEKDKLSLSVTDKHRMLVDKRTTGGVYVPEVWSADTFLGDYVQCRIRQTGTYEEGQTWQATEICLAVWFASDGYKQGDKVIFKFRKNRKVEALKALLDALGICYSFKKYDNDVVISFIQPSWVDDCYDELGNKKLPNEAMFMDNETYRCVKQALLESDGCLANFEFNNTSKVFAEQVQVLAHLHGDSMNLRYYGGGSKKRLYKSKFKESQHISLRRDKDTFEEDLLIGKVYCVSVPSTFLMVRRNGVVHISGNCEVMTHRSLSKNSSSSRAIPVNKMLEQIESNMAVPVYWGKNKAGMQAVEEVDDLIKSNAEIMWKGCFWKAKDTVSWLIEDGLHKQVANRLTEPFQMMKVVITGTDWDNFFNLRIHKDAQPEICMLAYKIYKAMEESKPNLLLSGQWHLPYVEIMRDQYNHDSTYYFTWDVDTSGTYTDGYKYEIRHTLEEAIKISASCCAQVSYRNTDMSLEKANKIFDMLIKADVLHASCFEHLATPIVEIWDKSGDTFDVFINKEKSKNVSRFKDTWQEGVTHTDKQGVLCSGNLTGWISYRQQLPSNTCWEFDFENRMSMFD